jgi:hypothetical protein
MTYYEQRLPDKNQKAFLPILEISILTYVLTTLAIIAILEIIPY